MTSKGSLSGSNNAGDFTRQCIDLFGQAMQEITNRARTEEPFSPDLKHGMELFLQATDTVNQSFLKTAHAQLDMSNEISLAGMDEALQSIGADDMLNAAIQVCQIPSGETAISTRSIELETGALRIPWLDIAKEILKKIVDFFPIPKPFKELIKCVLKLIDQFLEGKEHEPGGTLAGW